MFLAKFVLKLKTFIKLIFIFILENCRNIRPELGGDILGLSGTEVDSSAFHGSILQASTLYQKIIISVRSTVIHH